MHLLTVLLFACAAISAVAQDVISMPPLTQAARGAVVRLPVVGTITQSGSSQVAISFPADVIMIRSVEGGEGFAYRCDNLYMSEVQIANGTVGSVTVQCNDVVATTNDTLFEVVVEILRGPGTTGPIQSTMLMLNGAVVGNATFERGLIEAIGEPFIPTGTEGITGNYPNPFSTVSDFAFRVRQAGTVRLLVRNIQGRVVLDLGSFEATAGENVYQFRPGGWELAQGAYVMQLITDRGQYLHAFMVIK